MGKAWLHWVGPRGTKTFRDSDQSLRSLVQGLDLVLLQPQPVHHSLHQNHKRTEVRRAWVLPGVTNVLSTQEIDCREMVQTVAPRNFFFSFKEGIKVQRLIQTENTGRGIEPIGKDFGDNPKPINLFIWEFGAGSGGWKGVGQFPFVPHRQSPTFRAFLSYSTKQDAEGCGA